MPHPIILDSEVDHSNYKMFLQSFPGVHAGAGVHGAGVHVCEGEHDLGGGTETQQGRAANNPSRSITKMTLAIQTARQL